MGLRPSLLQPRRTMSSNHQETLRQKNSNMGLYFLSIAVGTLAASYAAVPLYKMYCQATGFGDEPIIATMEQAQKMRPVVVS